MLENLNTDEIPFFENMSQLDRIETQLKLLNTQKREANEWELDKVRIETIQEMLHMMQGLKLDAGLQISHRGDHGLAPLDLHTVEAMVLWYEKRTGVRYDGSVK